MAGLNKGRCTVLRLTPARSLGRVVLLIVRHGILFTLRNRPNVGKSQNHGVALPEILKPFGFVTYVGGVLMIHVG